MLPWIIAGVAASGLGIAASVSNNKAIQRNAEANAKATSLLLNQSYGVKKEQLFDKAEDVNNQVGMELTNLVYQSMGAAGTTTATIAERNITGNTATRLQGAVAIKEALTADQLVQSATSSLISVQNEMRNAKYEYESGSMQNTLSYNNALSQQQSGLSIAANALSTGLSVAGGVKTLMK